MAQWESSARFRELIGVGGPRIQWGRALAFMTAQALAVEGLLVQPALQHWPASFVWRQAAQWLFENALLGLVGLIAFRLVRNESLAALAGGITTGGIWVAPLWQWQPGFRIAPVYAVLVMTSCVMELLGMVLAVRCMRWFGLAVGIGRACALILTIAMGRLVERLSNPAASVDWAAWSPVVACQLLSVSIFAAVFWAGVQAADAGKGRLSKPFYLWSIMFGWAVGETLAVLVYVFSGRSDLAASLIGVSLALAVVSIYAAVVFLRLFYKAWEAIQDGYARTTPGKALGFLFIPFFNLYWVFQATWGLAKDYNRYAQRHSLDAPRLPASLFLVYLLSGFAGLIPYVGLVTWVLSYGMALVMISKICDAVNAIPEAETSTSCIGPDPRR